MRASLLLALVLSLLGLVAPRADAGVNGPPPPEPAAANGAAVARLHVEGVALWTVDEDGTALLLVEDLRLSEPLLVAGRPAIRETHVRLLAVVYGQHAPETFPLAADPVQGYAVWEYERAEGGRFVQRDPAKQDACYKYAGNRPTRGTDPSGRWMIYRDTYYRRAVAFADQQSDSVESLAKLLGLDQEESARWLTTYSGDRFWENEDWRGYQSHYSAEDQEYPNHGQPSMPDPSEHKGTFIGPGEVVHQGEAFTIPNVVLGALGNIDNPAPSTGLPFMQGVYQGAIDFGNFVSRYAWDEPTLDDALRPYKNAGFMTETDYKATVAGWLGPPGKLMNPDIHGLVWGSHGNGAFFEFYPANGWKLRDADIVIPDLTFAQKYMDHKLAVLELQVCHAGGSQMWYNLVGPTGKVFGTPANEEFKPGNTKLCELQRP